MRRLIARPIIASLSSSTASSCFSDRVRESWSSSSSIVLSQARCCWNGHGWLPGVEPPRREMLLVCITQPLISASQVILDAKFGDSLQRIVTDGARRAGDGTARGGRKDNEMPTHRSRPAGKSPTPTVGSRAGRPSRAAGGRGLYRGMTQRYSDTFAIFLLKARRREKDHDRVAAERAGQIGPSNMNRIEVARRIAYLLTLGSKALAAQRNNAVDRTKHQSLSSVCKDLIE
jgi:hypothetical protein